MCGYRLNRFPVFVAKNTIRLIQNLNNANDFALGCADWRGKDGFRLEACFRIEPAHKSLIGISVINNERPAFLKHSACDALMPAQANFPAANALGDAGIKLTCFRVVQIERGAVSVGLLCGDGHKGIEHRVK